MSCDVAKANGSHSVSARMLKKLLYTYFSISGKNLSVNTGTFPSKSNIGPVSELNQLVPYILKSSGEAHHCRNMSTTQQFAHAQ